MGTVKFGKEIKDYLRFTEKYKTQYGNWKENRQSNKRKISELSEDLDRFANTTRKIRVGGAMTAVFGVAAGLALPLVGLGAMAMVGASLADTAESMARWNEALELTREDEKLSNNLKSTEVQYEQSLNKIEQFFQAVRERDPKTYNKWLDVRSKVWQQHEKSMTQGPDKKSIRLELPAQEILLVDHESIRSLLEGIINILKWLTRGDAKKRAETLKKYCNDLEQELHKMENHDFTKWVNSNWNYVKLFTGDNFLKFDIVRIIEDKSTIIRAVESDVVLETPKGFHGTVFGNIHTDHSQIKKFVSRNECIVGPMCEYKIEHFGKEENYSEKFKLKIPHIIRDVDSVKYLIRVRKIVSNNVLYSLKRLSGKPLSTEDGFQVDSKYITIYTSNFCKFFVTVEAIKCCNRRVNVLLFGSLKNIKGEKPLTTLKVYFSATHCQISDYESALEKKESKYKRKLLDSKEITLSLEPYNSSKSRVCLNIKPNNQDVWTPYPDTQLHHECQLNEALKYDDGHLCKDNPTELKEFYLVSTEEEAKHYRGMLEGIFHITETSLQTESRDSVDNRGPEDAVENSSIKQRSFKILVDVQDEMPQLPPHRGHTLGLLTARELSKLAKRITPESMRVLALEYLDYEAAELETLATSRHSDLQQFKFDVLNNWTNKRDGNDRLRLVSILKEAAQNGLVDRAVIDDFRAGKL